MNAQDWSHADNPRAMLRVVRELTHRPPAVGPGPCGPRPEFHRLLRLFACAAARVVWLYVPDGPCRRAVGAAERFADGQATAAELEAAYRDANRVAAPTARGRPSAGWAAAYATDPDPFRAAQRAVEEVLELFPENPHETARNRSALGHLLLDLFDPYVRDPDSTPDDPPQCMRALRRFADHSLRDAAEQIYLANDFREFHLLGRRLQDAGLTDPYTLDHCKRGWHARGSWVVDALTGRGVTPPLPAPAGAST